MPKLSKPTKSQQIRMLDRKWSAFIRSHGICENCGTKDALTDSHIIGRSYIKTRFDPRNNQSLCFSCHGTFESQPVAFARWIETTTCGQHTDTMLVQANNTMVKPDYQLWFDIYDIIQLRGYTVEESRQWLGDLIIWSTLDLSKLA